MKPSPANESLEPMSAAEGVCSGFVALLSAAPMAQLNRSLRSISPAQQLDGRWKRGQSVDFHPGPNSVRAAFTVPDDLRWQCIPALMAARCECDCPAQPTTWWIGTPRPAPSWPRRSANNPPRRRRQHYVLSVAQPLTNRRFSLPFRADRHPLLLLCAL